MHVGIGNDDIFRRNGSLFENLLLVHKPAIHVIGLVELEERQTNISKKQSPNEA